MLARLGWTPPGPDTRHQTRQSGGGVFANGPSYVRSALRRSFDPDPEFTKTFGFRLVMVDEPESLPVEEPVDGGGTVEDDRAGVGGAVCGDGRSQLG